MSRIVLEVVVPRSLILARYGIVAAGIVLASASCGRKSVRARAPLPPARIGAEETGLASWYGVPYHGRRTASGEVYDMQQLTAAHRELPFETWVRVTNLANGKQVEVRINDRGPFVRGRIIDLSQAAARDIEMLGPGTAKVRLRVIPAPPDTVTRPMQAAPVTAQATNAPLVDSPPVVAGAGGLAKPAQPGAALQAIRPQLFAVQVGAFADRERAESLRASMVDQFVEARVVDNGKTPPLWRVLVGRELTSEQAAELIVLIQRVSSGAFVVPEP